LLLLLLLVIVRIAAVNLSAPFLLSDALLPLLSKKVGHPDSGGSIIHIASTRALQSEPHCEVNPAGCHFAGRGGDMMGGGGNRRYSIIRGSGGSIADK
jgi:NAD(P)-dependent dehydrogenase (short-subunit alcohol dehydrogenase family)